MSDLILLCRHMSRKDFAAGTMPVTGTQGAGGNDVPGFQAVAERLTETLLNERTAVTALLHAKSPIATETATRLAANLTRANDSLIVAHDPRLDEASFSRWQDRKPLDGFAGYLVDAVERTELSIGKDARALIVVGHEPQMDWLAEHLLRRGRWWARVMAAPVALRAGEVAAISIPVIGGNQSNRGHLEWTVSADETQAIEELREKIRSKMDLAKLLGGFMTLVLGGVVLAPGRLTELSNGGRRWAVYVAVGMFLAAVGLYLRTMYAYDSLLMPTRFWAQRFGRGQPRWLVRRPPSSAAWVLYQNMLHIWWFLFTPATIAVVLGLSLLAYASIKPGLVVAVVMLVLLGGVGVYALRTGPVTGSED